MTLNTAELIEVTGDSSASVTPCVLASERQEEEEGGGGRRRDELRVVIPSFC